MKRSCGWEEFAWALAVRGVMCGCSLEQWKVMLASRFFFSSCEPSRTHRHDRPRLAAWEQLRGLCSQNRRNNQCTPPMKAPCTLPTVELVLLALLHPWIIGSRTQHCSHSGRCCVRHFRESSQTHVEARGAPQSLSRRVFCSLGGECQLQDPRLFTCTKSHPRKLRFSFSSRTQVAQV